MGKSEVSVIAIGKKKNMNGYIIKIIIFLLNISNVVFIYNYLFIGSHHFNIYGLGDLMKERGWNLNILQEPSSVHLCCTMLHVEPGVADRFINDVKTVVKKVIHVNFTYQSRFGEVFLISIQ